MSLHLESYEHIKDLFIKKYTVIQNDDQAMLDALQVQYPELFSAEFMMEFLKETLIRWCE